MLEKLTLNHLDIDDEGFKNVTGLTRLKTLWFSESEITDYGFGCLDQLKHLEHIYIPTRIGIYEIDRLKKTNPNVIIEAVKRLSE